LKHETSHRGGGGRTTQGVRFLQLSPGEYFFTTLKVAGYTGVLLSAPSIIYEVAAFVVPGLTKSERNFLGPIVGGSSVLFYTGYTPSALALALPAARGGTAERRNGLFFRRGVADGTAPR
jgi:Sec-independent protein secretion pathway component TatC